jgi:excisionase family DNA binding protein
VLEIARRLKIGRMAVYSMLEQGIVPGVRLGRRWIITRHACVPGLGAHLRPSGGRWTSTPTRSSGGELMPVFKRKYESGKTVWRYMFSGPGSTRHGRVPPGRNAG